MPTHATGYSASEGGAVGSGTAIGRAWGEEAAESLGCGRNALPQWQQMCCPIGFAVEQITAVPHPGHWQVFESAALIVAIVGPSIRKRWPHLQVPWAPMFDQLAENRRRHLGHAEGNRYRDVPLLTVSSSLRLLVQIVV